MQAKTLRLECSVHLDDYQRCSEKVTLEMDRQPVPFVPSSVLRALYVIA